MPHEFVVVWLEEEYGYRYWRWEPGMTGEELIQWWKELKSVLPYFFSPAGGVAKCGKRHSGLPGKLEERSWENFPRVDVPNLWRAHIHEDEDSYLKLPDGEYVHHAGYKDYDF